MSPQRTYDVRTHGCQMNVHDSERLAGLLETAGYVDLASVPQGERPEVADVVVFNTCAVRENADNKLYGNLGQLRPAKTRNPDLQIAVGGCMAQKDRATIVQRAPWVDVVFGTHNIGSLPALLDRARHNRRAEVEILESLETFPSTLPTPSATAPTPPGCRSASAATTRAPSASSPACAARSRTVDRATSSPRSRRSSPRVSSR
jgi:tRNA-2-methylthio-N6-dimethylallyladenosine synthase